MPSWVWVLIAIAVVAVLAVVVWQALARRRTGKLQQQFGPEYDRTLDKADSKREAEAELQAREERRQQLEIRPLSQAARDRYLQSWQSVQAQFVDDPRSAVASADSLIQSVMTRARLPGRGFRPARRRRLRRPPAGRRELPARTPARPGKRGRQRLDRGPPSGDAPLPGALRRARRTRRRPADHTRTTQPARRHRPPAKRKDGALGGRRPVHQEILCALQLPPPFGVLNLPDMDLPDTVPV